ncbi:ABC transporter substrate-binding protein [Leifsonia sp. H3M29-4]|uniref:ABC transporter substrate-binding protein n=1 Tax=Salinibacterium metalliresistens TaxID=3031321 RepID=UPI0023DB0199|nr:ABC transporter substrate-binding protein [Salinibacterium metalliresistens]MDF1478502.1 ABC transporter substrate-binding protein [Salinibacterium metalliresistens]
MRTGKGRAAKGILLGAAMATTVTLAISGCATGGDSGNTEDQEPYQVLVLGALSAEGVLANNAATSVLSAKASAQVINEEGGILGREVVVTVVDDTGDPTTAVTKLREAINSDTPPDLVLNSGPSTVADAMLPIIAQAGIMSFNIGPTATSSDPSAFPLNFDLSPGPAQYAKGFVEHMEAEGYETVGIIHGSSSYGETFGAIMEETLTKAGFDVLKNEEYDVASLDMTPQLETIKAENPDALVLDAYGAPLGYVLQGIEKLGWDVPIVGNNSVAATGLISTPPPTGVLGTDQVKNLVMEVFNSTVFNKDATLVNQAVEAMVSIDPIKATLILAYNYDSLRLIRAAAEKVGSLDDPAALAKALEDPEVTGSAETAILSHYTYSAKSHAPEVSGTEFAFIPPSEVRDGQYHPKG